MGAQEAAAVAAVKQNKEQAAHTVRVVIVAMGRVGQVMQTKCLLVEVVVSFLAARTHREAVAGVDVMALL